jgi:hypothetical protein
VLKHCAANRKRRLSALPNVGPYIHDVKISGFPRSSIYIYIYDISRLRVSEEVLQYAIVFALGIEPNGKLSGFSGYKLFPLL